ncbi:MAG: peptidoglycan DD-metalloendopeptidase family protein [Proteobacteria bacterium]|nr:peptidoglycan DD-metalloendopeptidase family protein [Desulfobacula sp.]MBU0973786.1 peptidoglycan DD-metalloendopeptidase family protein [Pseudomonadota bacterium]
MGHNALNVFRWGLSSFVIGVLLGLCSPLNAVAGLKATRVADMATEIGDVKTIVPFKKTFIDGYRVERNIVREGQTMSVILKPYGVSESSIFKTSKIGEDIFDVRQIKPGLPYLVDLDPEQKIEVKYFPYEITPKKFVSSEFGISPNVIIGQKQLEKKTRQVSGTISSSLWKSMKIKNMSVDLILKVNELIGSQMDFRKLRPKDSFNIVFEEYSDGSQIVKTGEIVLVQMKSGNKEFSAFRFFHHGMVGYYDEMGNNLQTDFLKYPLKFNKITSKFSLGRKHPVTRKIKSHPAIDFGAPAGTPVMSIGDGIVDSLGYSATAGNYIKISHPDSFESQYLHLKSIESNLEKGSKVNKEDVIGFVGSTGLTTGEHLDFRLSKNGQLIDYLNFDLPDGQPVDEACRDKFFLSMQQVLAKIKNENIFKVETTS